MGKQRGYKTERWFLWSVFAFILGIAYYFSLLNEPGWGWFLGGAVFLAAFSLLLAFGRFFPYSLLLAAFFSGIFLAKIKTELVASPVLHAPLSNALLEGRVFSSVLLNSGHILLHLEVKGMSGISQEQWPRFVDIFIKSPSLSDWKRGDILRLHANLRPPKGPLVPFSYDHAREDWFLRVGGVGSALDTPKVIAQHPLFWQFPLLWSDRLAQALNQAIAKALQGRETMGLAQALITGERRFVPEDVLDALKVSGIYHILSISGFHMSLVAGGAFFLLRAFLALLPGFALYFPIKKWAACFGLWVGGWYLALSGGDVATWRSYLMIALMFVGVLWDRQSVSLETLAWSALLILVFFPEDILSPSFQMSFLAVVGLVCFYEWYKQQMHETPSVLLRKGFFWVWGFNPLMMAVCVSLIAGFSTFFSIAYHFQLLSTYSVITNVFVLPLLSFWVMPLGVLGVCLFPFGWEAWAFRVMDQGLFLLLKITRQISALPSAGALLPQPSFLASWLMGGGMIVFCLMSGKKRFLGLGVLGVGFLSVWFSPRPNLWVDARASNVVLRNWEGKLVPLYPNRAKSSVKVWLRQEGDGVSQKEATTRQGWFCAKDVCRGRVGEKRIVVQNSLIKKEACPQKADLFLVLGEASLVCEGVKQQLDRLDFQIQGAFMFFAKKDYFTALTTKEAVGKRPWTPREFRSVMQEDD